MLEAIIALMMVKVNKIDYTLAPMGEYYEVSDMGYDSTTDTTYGLFSRYYVIEGHNIIGRHYQVRPYKGNVTKEDLIKDARDRCDSYVNVVSAIK